MSKVPLVLPIFVFAVAMAACQQFRSGPKEAVVPNDDENLQAINQAINDAENSGDRIYLDSVIAPELAFLRANGTFNNRQQFLDKVLEKKLPSRTMEIETIEVLGNRAIVKCIITQGGKQFHNVRLFVRIEEQWKLLGWANEPLA